MKYSHKAAEVRTGETPAQTRARILAYGDDRTFADWLGRSGGAAEVGSQLKVLDEFPEPDVAPDFYVDFDETGPYIAEVGDSECAT